MSRHARQRSITDIYHVIQRGIDRMLIFREADDYQMFLNLLRLEANKSFEVYCYCLMDNHVHFIVRSDNLSFYIHHLASIYAMWFNHKYERHGYLFQDRFKSEAIEDEGYFLRCFRYILKNPVKAGICKTVAAYRWNSYQAYFSKNMPWITTQFQDSYFDSKEDFQSFIDDENTDECMDINLHNNLTDHEALVLFQKKLNGKELTELSPQQQRLLLKEMKETPGIRNKQLARISGVGFNIIRRL